MIYLMWDKSGEQKQSALFHSRRIMLADAADAHNMQNLCNGKCQYSRPCSHHHLEAFGNSLHPSARGSSPPSHPEEKTLNGDYPLESFPLQGEFSYAPTSFVHPQHQSNHQCLFWQLFLTFKTKNPFQLPATSDASLT